MPKAKGIRGDKVVRGGPLADDIIRDGIAKQKVPGRKKGRKRQAGEDEFVESDLTKKILSEAWKQQQEMEEQYGVTPSSSSGSKKRDSGQKILTGQPEDEDCEVHDDESKMAMAEGMQGPVEIDPEEEKAFEMFMSKKGHRSLADIIQSKLQEKKTEVQSIMSDDPEGGDFNVTPEMATFCRKIGDILKRYRSGKLPVALKRMPTSDNWEQLLFLTEPDQWTAAAMYAATKVFCSNLPACLAQRFCYRILLPRIRDDIQEYRRLNFHLMMALRKALFKTSAFFKGIVLALCESGDCTLREALIVSSVLRESSIPMAHAGAAMDRIASMEYTGASSIFLRTLLDKKYALSYSVIGSICQHFYRFMSDDRNLPVLWHQCLLTFVQRHKNDLYQSQKDQLYQLIKKHVHHEISPEIRRELENSSSREESAGMEVSAT